MTSKQKPKDAHYLTKHKGAKWRKKIQAESYRHVWRLRDHRQLVTWQLNALRKGGVSSGQTTKCLINHVNKFGFCLESRIPFLFQKDHFVVAWRTGEEGEMRGRKTPMGQ